MERRTFLQLMAAAAVGGIAATGAHSTVRVRQRRADRQPPERTAPTAERRAASDRARAERLDGVGHQRGDRQEAHRGEPRQRGRDHGGRREHDVRRASPTATSTPASSSGRRASATTSRSTSTTAAWSRSASSAPSAGSAGTSPTTCRSSTPRPPRGRLQGPRAVQAVRQRRDRRPGPLPRHRSVVLASRRGDHRATSAFRCRWSTPVPRPPPWPPSTRRWRRSRRSSCTGGSRRQRRRSTTSSKWSCPSTPRSATPIRPRSRARTRRTCWSRSPRPELAEKDPAVSNFLAWFTMTNEDQLPLLPAVEIDGEDAADVAAGWVEDERGRRGTRGFQEGPPPTTPADRRPTTEA